MSKLIMLVLSCLVCISISSCMGNDQGKVDLNKDIAENAKHQLNQRPGYLDDPAIIELKKKLDEDIGNPDLNFQLGVKYHEYNEFNSARNYLLKAMDLAPGNAEFKRAYANTFSDEGKMNDAEEIFTELLESDPNDIETMISWGVMYLRLGMIEKNDEYTKKATDLFDNVLEIDEKNIKALFNLGLISRFDDDLDGAKNLFMEIHKIDPDRENAVYHIAKIAYEQHDYELLEEFSVKALEIKENPEFYYYLGIVEFERQNYQAARENFESALSFGIAGKFANDAREKILEIKQFE